MAEKNEKRKKAVALKYEKKENPAPQILARGAGKIAENILSVGSEKKVPIVDDKDLLQLLYPLKPGEFIPESLYLPIAKLLAYISYFHKNKRSKKQEHQL